MYVEHIAQKPIAHWNSARDVWEKRSKRETAHSGRAATVANKSNLGSCPTENPHGIGGIGRDDAPGESQTRGQDSSPSVADSKPSESEPAFEWGEYATAIRVWERVRGLAPYPAELRAPGKYRLKAEFAEWMMGLEPGHVTGVPGVTRNQQLKAIGNGVHPQQAIAALEDMLDAR